MSVSRRKERETVFEMLFAMEFSPAPTPQEEDEIYFENSDGKDAEALKSSDYVRDTFFGAAALSEKTEELLNECAIGWKRDRISKVSLAIIKLAVYELSPESGISENIAINEAVELSKKYDDEKVSAFVNAVLGKIAKAMKADDE